jgi:hypothetical protein
MALLIPLVISAPLYYVASRYRQGSSGYYGWGFVATMVLAAGIYL